MKGKEEVTFKEKIKIIKGNTRRGKRRTRRIRI